MSWKYFNYFNQKYGHAHTKLTKKSQTWNLVRKKSLQLGKTIGVGNITLVNFKVALKKTIKSGLSVESGNLSNSFYNSCSWKDREVENFLVGKFFPSYYLYCIDYTWTIVEFGSTLQHQTFQLNNLSNYPFQLGPQIVPLVIARPILGADDVITMFMIRYQGVTVKF